MPSSSPTRGILTARICARSVPCLLLLVADLAAQTVTGNTTLHLDPKTDLLTATCETALDQKLQPFYGAEVECIVTDGSGKQIIAGHQDDIDGHQGYARAVLTSRALAGTIYFALGKHRVVFRTPTPAGESGQTPYLDPYNIQSVRSHFAPGEDLVPPPFRFTGPGPSKAAGSSTLPLARTYDSVAYPLSARTHAALPPVANSALVGVLGADNYGCSLGQGEHTHPKTSSSPARRHTSIAEA